MKKTVSFTFIILILILLFSALKTHSQKSLTAYASIGQISPEIELNDLNNKKHVLSDSIKNNKPVLINFWATWCLPCKMEMPIMNELYETYHDRLNIYAINVTKKDNVSDIQPIIDRLSFLPTVLLDIKGDIANKYNVASIPTTFLIDQKGVVLEKITGEFSKQEIINKIDLMLGGL